MIDEPEDPAATVGRARKGQPYRFERTISADGAAERFGPLEPGERAGAEVSVAGRVLLSRPQGRLAFSELRDSSGAVQLFALAASTEDFDEFCRLNLGDWIGAHGECVRTKRGELSVKVARWELLAETRRGFGDKWHGVTDVETRYRQREVDLWANPGSRQIQLNRSLLVRRLRERLWDLNFIEVETPILHPIPGGAMARPFVTHHNTLDVDLYLRIAPELYLKRLVVGGFEKVFEIGRLFRNEGISTQHNPEFTMLEFYQAYTDYQGVMDLTQEIITQAAKDVTGGTKTKWGGGEIDWANWQRMKMREAIIHYWPESSGAKPEMSDFGSADGVKKLVERFNAGHAHMAYEPDAAAGKTLAGLFEAVAEEHLTQPTIIYEFPTAVSPLSKQKPDEPEWTERWEIFVGQMEIANGFSELNDPEDQRRRFEGQLQERERGDEEAHQMDEDYIRALSYGMPPAGGVGVGIDRLCMLLTDPHTIRDLILFPLLRPEKNITIDDTGDTGEKL